MRDNTESKVVEIAAIPEENTSPSSAPSNAQILSITASALTDVIRSYSSVVAPCPTSVAFVS